MREAFLGDLEERFRWALANGCDPRRARRWFWRETLCAPLFVARPPAGPASSTPSGDRLMTTLMNDLRFALRLLARQPGFTVVAALTLALGIGATTAIFSAVYPILLAPLPFPQADRIVMVQERDPDGSASNVGFATFRDVVDASRSIETAAAYGDWQTVITGHAEPERLEGQRVSATFFRTLGVAPALGRDFLAPEDVRGAPRVTILSHALWRSRFGGDSTIVGRQIDLDGNAFTVVGVLPATFESVLDPRARLWTTLRYDVALPYACRTCRHLRMVARLKPGVRLETVRRELNVISQRLVADHPTDYASPGFLVPTLREQVTGGVRPALLAILGAVGLVLLIACANVTNLLLARSGQRHGEFAVRTALGAAHGRMVRQLLTESLLLAALGGALGVGVAVIGVRILVVLSPPDLPRLQTIGVNGPVLLFAVLVSTLVGLIFGLAPAVQAVRGDVHLTLQRSTRRTTRGRRVSRMALVVSEMALALLLLVSSGLLLRSMMRLFAVAPGFSPDGVLTLQVQTGGPRFATDSATWAFFDRVLAAVRDVPGVAAAAFTSQLPLSGDYDAYGIHVQSKPRANPEEDPAAFRYAITPGYLETLHIPLLRGRSFVATDRANQPPVALISETFAHRAWPGEDPIGARIRVGDPTTGPWRTVIGITGDVKQVSLAAEQPNAVYVPETQWQFADFAMSLVVRTRGEPTALVPALRHAIWAVDKDQPIVRVAMMDRLVAATAATRRFTLVLFEVFAAVALALAAAGIYSVLSGMVVERRQEVGVRAALGASRADILMMVVREGLGLASAGVAIGLGAAVALTRFIHGLLYGVPPIDPLTYSGVAAVLVIVAIAACWVPAWRAARLDPAEVLRAE
jgi:putative ABC transport system permease protein